MSNRNSRKPTRTNRDDSHAIAVFGGGAEGRSIAERLAESDREVFFYDEAPAVLRRTNDAVTTGQVMLNDVDSLACTAATEASVVVVAGQTDRRNLLLAQLLRTTIGVTDVVIRVNETANADAFANIDLELVAEDDDVAAAISSAVERTLRQPTKT